MSRAARLRGPGGLEAALAAVDRGRLADLLLAAVEQYSPSYAEEPAMAVFAEALGTAGISHVRQPVDHARESAGTRANLLVEVGPRPPALLWVGHADTIPYLDEESQTARLEGDTVHGLGAADMKGGCAAVIEALVALREAGVELARGLAVALVVGEEEYGDGSEALRERVSAPLTVVGEPTGLVPCLSHYGYFEYRLTSRGAEAHAALPEVGANAIHAMLSWLTFIMEERERPAYADAVTVNPRAITGGAHLFVVARECEADIDVHTAHAAGLDEVAALIEAARARAARGHPGCAFSSELVFSAPGYALSGQDPALEPLRRAFARTGLAWAPGVFRSHSDAVLFHERGSPTVICGPGRLEVAHTRGEHVSLDEVERAARLYAALIFEACAA